MVDAGKISIVEKFIDAYNRFDVDGMLALVAADIQFENISNGQITACANGVGEFRLLADLAKSLFSHRQQKITTIELRAASVVATIAYRGVLALDLPNGVPAGAVIELIGESEFAFVGEKISRIVDRS